MLPYMLVICKCKDSILFTKQETFKRILYGSGSFLPIQKEVGAGCYQPRGMIS